MKRDLLVKYITAVLPMPTDKASFFAEQFEPKDLLKNDLLLTENKISKHTYILEIGFIRSYTFNNNGAEVTTNIFSAPCFVNDFLAFFKQKPNSENYQCATDCKLWTISYDNVQHLFHNHPGQPLLNFHQ